MQEETRCEAELGSILYSYYKRWATQINGGSTLASRDLQFLQDVTDFGASIDPEYETYDIAATIDAEPLAMAAAYSSTSKLTMDYIQQCELCTTYSPQFCTTSTPTPSTPGATPAAPAFPTSGAARPAALVAALAAAAALAL